jgi:ABC-type Fe3+ transport system substrate-binding protein
VASRPLRRFCAGLLGLLIALPVSLAHAEDPALIAAARKEGRVVWYTTLIANQVVDPLKAAFEKKYPGVTLDYSRADEQPNAVKILDEARAGRLQADVYDGLMIMEAFKRAGLAAPFSIPNAAAYPPQTHDKDGTWRALLLFVFAEGYNSNMVSAAAAPKTYQDLLDPRWKGKMAWNANSIAGAYGFVGNILLSMGETRGMAYLRALSKQDVVGVGASSRAILDQVIAGEYPIELMTFNYHAVISANKGAPARWLPLQPAPVAFDSVGLLKGAPHPAAAKLLLDYLLSDEGQRVIAKADYLPALPSVPAVAAGLRPDDGHFQATWLRPEVVYPHLAQWASIAKELFP